MPVIVTIVARFFPWSDLQTVLLFLCQPSVTQNSSGYCFIGMERSEETPLLSSDHRNLNNEEIYNRFAPERKRGILAIVSLTGLIPRTCISNKSSSSYVVSLHNISFCLRNFHSCYTPNCRRPWLDGTHRKVSILGCRKVMIYLFYFYFTVLL